jgi:RNA polymerase sigma-70 factor (ECF subfamily)
MFDQVSARDDADTPVDSDSASRQADVDPLGLLLLRVRHGDQRAFKRVYDMTAPRLLSKALSILSTRDTADDVLQETYVRIWRNIAQFDPARGSAATWILRILRNAAIDRLRHDRTIARYQTTTDTLPDLPIAPEPVTDRIDLDRALARISPEQRASICRVVVHGWTHDEVGKLDGVPTPTAKARVQRGLRRLHAALTDIPPDARVANAAEKALA